ncbi:iron-regulated protein, partial [Klebsiella pneumoniae]
YHAAKDIGVPLHLADLKAEKPLVLLLTTAGATLTAKQADYIWSVAAEK